MISAQVRRSVPRHCGRLISLACAALCAFTAWACSPIITKHGHQFRDKDVEQIQAGMTQEQVRSVLGSPATTATLGRGNAYYYISSTTSQVSFLTPTEIDRKVLAVYFSQHGTVERVAHYGLKDGKVFDFISRTTPPADTRDESLIRQMFRNLGQKQLFGG
ncbi:MAG TPA: outer membrane protein assembly factor BamE [Hyphomicrobiaceae bacterium]|nr:outer membrane protein assembly factor BamE [Hyphomicrobiaceae bacterium]